MKNRITVFTGIMFLLISFNSLSQTIKWEDRMNGDNSVAGLQGRGWIVLNEDGGGSSNPWFQGIVSVFPSFEGPDSGYVASNWNGANSNNIVDQWLISPILNINVGDSLSFLARSPDLSDFDDSIYVMLSTNAGTTPSDFISLGRFLVSINSWQLFYWISEINATIRVAIRYYLFDAQTNADYIGLDLIQVHSHSSSYPSTIAINKSFGFTNITSSSSYRMIGLPGQTNFPIPVTGTRGTDWNAFYDNGAATNYLIEYDGTNNFNFNPGNGFWLLSKNAISINVQVNSVPLAGDNTYSIPLHSGWNIISNPFERSTNWSAVQFANLLAGNGVIYDWGGSWTNPSLFSPYKAYYFNNVNSQTNLWIPYDPSGILGKASDENTLQIAGENDIKLLLLSNGEEKSKAFIGFNSESNSDFDDQDYFAPPADFEEARIVIRNNNLSTDYKYLMKESRSEIGDGQIYYLDVKNLTNQDLTFRIDGLSNYEDYLVYLIDERLKNPINLSENSEIKLPSKVTNSSFRFLIGTKQFIEANKENLAPKQFALYQNYPNPFNPTTTIRYSVSATSIVNIKIYDLLGNELITLINEEHDPGNYEIEFDASDIASGVYIYRIQAGKFTDTKKMILLR